MDLLPSDPRPWAPPGLRERAQADVLPKNSGTAEILDVIQALEAANISTCVVGVRALRYFGAGRVTQAVTYVKKDWEICVSDQDQILATQLFETLPLRNRYDRVLPPYPDTVTFRHRHPTFKLKGVVLYFLLVPSSDSFCDPRPEFCQRSQSNIPYPQDTYYVRSVLVRQQLADLDDFVDAQDSTLEWGQENLDFPRLRMEGALFAERLNAKADADGQVRKLSLDRDFAEFWKRSVLGKPGRIEPMKQGRYVTRWRPKGYAKDPRIHDPQAQNRARDHV